MLMNIRHPEDIDLTALPSVPLGETHDLPTSPGIYFALIESGEVLYVGMGESLRQRWQKRHHRRKQLEEAGNIHLAWLTIDDPSLLYSVEKALIDYLDPPLNRTLIPLQKGS